MRGPLALRRQPKSVLRNRQKGVRRNHIDTTGSYLDAGPDFLHRILVPFAMISVSMLWWLGFRCCTSTNAFRYPPAAHERTLHTPPGRPLTHDGHDRERGLLSCSSFAGTPIRHQTRIWIFRMSSSRPAGRSERGPGSRLFRGRFFAMQLPRPFSNSGESNKQRAAEWAGPSSSDRQKHAPDRMRAKQRQADLNDRSYTLSRFRDLYDHHQRGSGSYG